MAGEIQTILKDLMDPVSQATALMAAVGGKLGYVASKFDQCRSAIKDRSLKTLVAELQREFQQLESQFELRMDREGLPPNEFYEMFQLTVDATTRTTREEKIQILAKLLTNILLPQGDTEKLSWNEVEHFTRCIDALSVESIQLLGTIWKVVKSKQQPSAPASALRRLSGHVTGAELRAEFPGGDADLVMGSVSQLAVWNLVYTDLPGVRTIDAGWVTNQNTALTSLGSRLVHFIMDSQTQAACAS